jgi:histidine triad (HIT) family protein
MDDCIFCKIVSGEIPKKFDYQDQNIVAFADIHPVKPVHILLVPKKHIDDLFNLEDKSILDSVKIGVRQIVAEKKLLDRGYRVVVNGGGAQIVNHLHFHLIGPMGHAAKL